MTQKPLQPNGGAQSPAPYEIGPRPGGARTHPFLRPRSVHVQETRDEEGRQGGSAVSPQKGRGRVRGFGETARPIRCGRRFTKERVCGPGDVVHFPIGAVHQEEALEDTVILEVSTPFLNDRVRVEPLYGMEIPEGGLPSTVIEEVTEAK